MDPYRPLRSFLSAFYKEDISFENRVSTTLLLHTIKVNCENYLHLIGSNCKKLYTSLLANNNERCDILINTSYQPITFPGGVTYGYLPVNHTVSVNGVVKLSKTPVNREVDFPERKFIWILNWQHSDFRKSTGKISMILYDGRVRYTWNMSTRN